MLTLQMVMDEIEDTYERLSNHNQLHDKIVHTTSDAFQTPLDK